MVVKVLVPISGGKDSQASLKMAIKEHGVSSVRGLFCDTKFEHPLTYAHIERLRTMYGDLQIDTVSGGSVIEKTYKYGRFPGGGARHCTDELKIRETRIYCNRLAVEQRVGFEVWYGMRSGESAQRAKRYAGKVCDELYAPHDVLPSKYPKYLEKLGVMFRLCILDWTTEEVFDYLGGEENPLYAAGFERVGCFPCLAAGDAYKEKAFNHDDFGRGQYLKIKKVSKDIGKSIWTSKGGRFRNENQGCLICSI
jgi:3'-phosphoadenosine 5'-phosphosulfate sulfotransferase (PAPS reductase)/FAD synthetase